MRLASYLWNGKPSYGPVLDCCVVDVPSEWPDGPRDLLEALAQGKPALERISRILATGKRVPLADVTLLPPVPNAGKVIGLAGNYAAHLQEWRKTEVPKDSPRLTTTPRPFLMPATCLVGHGATIPWPSYSKQIDYEIELAIVIGARAKDVSPEDARGCIAGYTIANDISARSVTLSEGRAKRPWDEFYDWLHGKWADGFCPMGPWIVTADEVPDVRDLHLELAINGHVRQSASSGQMIFDVYEVVSFLSHLMTLLPGDVIATGTPQGVGAATGNYLKAGDTMHCRITHIGELTNSLGQPPAKFFTPCAK